MRGERSVTIVFCNYDILIGQVLRTSTSGNDAAVLKVDAEVRVFVAMANIDTLSFEIFNKPLLNL